MIMNIEVQTMFILKNAGHYLSDMHVLYIFSPHQHVIDH